jgi:prolyl oligopeptidase
MLKVFLQSTFACLPLFLGVSAYSQSEKPPVAPVRPVVNEYFGQKVTDPYQYMEDLKSREVQQWLQEQADYARAVLDSIPGRKKMLADVTKYGTAPVARVTHLVTVNGFLFYQKILPTDNLPKLYVRQGISGVERMLLDPGKLGTDKAHVGISFVTPSWDGKYIAIALSQGGSEMATLHVYEVATMRETGRGIDRIAGDPPSVAWLPDQDAFYYTRLQKLAADAPATELYQKAHVYLHWIGKDPAQDSDVFGEGVNAEIQINPLLMPVLITAPTSHYTVAQIITTNGGAAQIYVAPIQKNGVPGAWQRVADLVDDVWDALPVGDVVYLVSAKNAPRFQVLEVNAIHPVLSEARVLLPPGKDVVMGDDGLGLNALLPAKDSLYVKVFDGASAALVRISYGTDPKPVRISAPWPASIFGATSDIREPGAYVSLGGWTHGANYYRVIAGSSAFTKTDLVPPSPYTDLAGLVAKDVGVRAADGTMIPLSLVYKQGVVQDGKNPTFLWGYGGYGISQSPFFNPILLPWFDHGGIFAVAHVRGGGELGEEWHKAGMMLTKPNTWNDAIACAEYLIAQRYTSSEKLALAGASAGGILAGRALTERPDLFTAVLDMVPVSDTLRFERTANGANNISELGSVKTSDGFRGLYAMSPYVHVKDGVHYPAVLLTTGINDPRVDPWQPAKMAARLQAANGGAKSILFRVDYDAGHGVDTRKQAFEEWTDYWTFLLWQMGDADFQPTAAKTISPLNPSSEFKNRSN